MRSGRRRERQEWRQRVGAKARFVSALLGVVLFGAVIFGVLGVAVSEEEQSGSSKSFKFSNRCAMVWTCVEVSCGEMAARIRRPCGISETIWESTVTEAERTRWTIAVGREEVRWGV